VEQRSEVAVRRNLLQEPFADDLQCSFESLDLRLFVLGVIERGRRAAGDGPAARLSDRAGCRRHLAGLVGNWIGAQSRADSTLQEGSTGDVVKRLQTVLTNGAPGQWMTTPGVADGIFGPHTERSVEAFQSWAGAAVDGIVGDQTWSVSLHAMSATLESAVGLQYVIG
jgi:Putative peptidoglycan binding domain